MEATFPKLEHGHMNGEAIGIIAKKSNIKKLIIVHIGKYYQKLGTVKKEIKINYSNKIIIGKEYQKFKL